MAAEPSAGSSPGAAVAVLRKRPRPLGGQVWHGALAVHRHEDDVARRRDRADAFGQHPVGRHPATAARGSTVVATGGPGHDPLDDLVERGARHLRAQAGIDVIGPLAGQAVPQVVVCQQARDAGREVGGVRADEGVLALDEVQPLGADGVVTTGV